MSLLGQRFRQVREERGISVLQAEIDTRIRASVIQALEEGISDNLPPEPFLRGLIRSYANYLRLDPQEMLDLYSTDIAPAPPPVVPVAPQRPAAVPHPAIPRPSLENLVDSYDKAAQTPEPEPQNPYPPEPEPYLPPQPQMPASDAPKPYIPQPPGPLAAKNRRLKPPPALFQRRSPTPPAPAPAEPPVVEQGPAPRLPSERPEQEAEPARRLPFSFDRPKPASPRLVQPPSRGVPAFTRRSSNVPPAPTGSPESLPPPESFRPPSSIRAVLDTLGPALITPIRTMRRPIPIPALVLIMVAVVASCLACGLFSYLWITADNPSTALAQPTVTRTRSIPTFTPAFQPGAQPTQVPTLAGVEPTVEHTPILLPSPSPTTPTAPTHTPGPKAALNLDVKASQTITMQIGVDGAMVFNGPIAAGTSRTFTASKALYVRVENPLGATIHFNGNSNWFLPLVLPERTVLERAWTASPTGKVNSTKPVPPTGAAPEPSDAQAKPAPANTPTPSSTVRPRLPTPTLTPFS